MQKLTKKSPDGQTDIYLGEINNGIYSRRVKNKHIYHYKDFTTGETIDGWTIDKDACESVVFPECTSILLKNVEEHKIYMIEVKVFMQEAISLRDRYFLALDGFQISDDRKPFKRVPIIRENI